MSGTAVAAFFVALPFLPTESVDRAWHGADIGPDVVLVVLAAVVLLTVWTSRLYVDDTTITASAFFRSASMPLVDVAEVKWCRFVFPGGKICRVDGSGVHTLVTMKMWGETTSSRADRIRWDIEGRASRARLLAGR